MHYGQITDAGVYGGAGNDGHITEAVLNMLGTFIRWILMEALPVFSVIYFRASFVSEPYFCQYSVDISSRFRQDFVKMSSTFRQHFVGSRIQDPGYRIQDPGSRIQDPGYRIQDPGSRILDTGSRILDP